MPTPRCTPLPAGSGTPQRRVTTLGMPWTHSARRSGDTRVIISAYGIENNSDDHPYMSRYTARRVRLSSITPPCRFGAS